MVTQQGQYKNLPEGWLKIREEVSLLLMEGDPDYKKRLYITPSRYLWGIKDSPDKYPLLSKLTHPLQKRYISYFLIGQGRVKRGTKTSKSQVWMLKEALE